MVQCAWALFGVVLSINQLHFSHSQYLIGLVWKEYAPSGPRDISEHSPLLVIFVDLLEVAQM